MSEKLRNALIRIALIAILACYYVGGLVADNPRTVPPSEFAPLSDLAADLDRRRAALETANALADEDQRAASIRDQSLVIAIVARQMACHDQREALQGPQCAGPLPSPGAEPLIVLTRQIPLCYEQLRHDIYSSRFAEHRAALAARAATMAVLANYCSDENECRPEASPRGEWEEICLALRDSAADVNLACHAGNQTAAMAALRRVEVSCRNWLEAAEKR